MHAATLPAQGKCLHDYFYFIGEDLGLCYPRVPTWAPFGLQFYGNGHSALARMGMMEMWRNDHLGRPSLSDWRTTATARVERPY